MAAPYRLLLSTVFLLRPLKETMIEKTEIFRSKHAQFPELLLVEKTVIANMPISEPGIGR